MKHKKNLRISKRKESFTGILPFFNGRGYNEENAKAHANANEKYSVCRIKRKTLTEITVLVSNNPASAGFAVPKRVQTTGRLLPVRPTFLLILPVLMRGDAALMCLLIQRAETL